MRIGIFHQTGLGTDPKGDCCGARKYIEALSEKYRAPYMIYAWDDPKSDAAYATAVDYYHVLLVTGHSHGAGEIVKKLNRTVSFRTQCRIVTGIIDDCPFGEVLTPIESPAEPPSTVQYGVAVWQRNFQPMGRAFKPRECFVAREMTEYELEGVKHKLGHVAGDPTPEFESIAGDAVVWALIEAALVFQINAITSPGASHDTARAEDGGFIEVKPLPAPEPVTDATTAQAPLGGGA